MRDSTTAHWVTRTEGSSKGIPAASLRVHPPHPHQAEGEQFRDLPKPLCPRWTPQTAF